MAGGPFFSARSLFGSVGLPTRLNGQIIRRFLIPGLGLDMSDPLRGDIEVKPWARGGTLLGVFRAANLNSTADQRILIRRGIPRYSIDYIDITNASGTPTTAVGGFYTAPSKAGLVLVANSQVYSSLSSINARLKLAVTASDTLWLTGPAIYFALDIAQGAAMTADIRIFGTWID